MISNVFRFVLVLTFVCISPVHAQSIYVAGSIGLDISLVSGQKATGVPASVPTRGDESLSGAARLGVLIDRWGIELEVARAAEMRETFQPNIASFRRFVGAPQGIAPETEHRTRTTTVSATASIRQQVSDTVALAYLGGVVFHRTDRETRLRGGFTRSGLFEIPPLSALPSGVNVITYSASLLPSGRAETVAYGAGPVVGFEAHFGYGEHFFIVPGIRMHGLPGSWLVRPSAGAGWSF